MAWIESHQALDKHPKVLQLAKACGWSVDETIGKLHRFWWWCLDYATDGRLDKFDHSTIASVFGVQEHGENVVQVLLKLRWLDSEPEIRVHDWWDYAGRFLQVRYKRTPKVWKEIKRFYGHSIQRTNNRTTTELSAINNHKPNQPNLTNLNQPDLTKPIEDGMPLRATVVRDDFFLDLKKNPAYAHIDLDRENGKMDAWLGLPANKNRIKTRKFVLNWLNKIEAPLPNGKPEETAFEKFLRR